MGDAVAMPPPEEELQELPEDGEEEEEEYSSSSGSGSGSEDEGSDEEGSGGGGDGGDDGDGGGGGEPAAAAPKAPKQPKPSKKRGRLTKAGGKRVKKARRSAFIDDAAEVDDDDDSDGGGRGGAGRRALKRSRFIDDIAEVDDDEGDDEDDGEGVDDLIDDGGEAPDAADQAEVRRAVREAELQAAKDEELNPEELEAYLKQRFGGRRAAGYAAAAGGEAAGAVAQQALQPTPRDAKLWVVRCREGGEREAVVCLLQKAYTLGRRGAPLLVKAAFTRDGLKGYIYVEAHKEAHVREALAGLAGVFHSRPPKLVPLGEMVDAISAGGAGASAAPRLQPGGWARVRAGAYKGDLARVVDVDAGAGRATVRLVPRLDYAALAAKGAPRDEAAAGAAAAAARGRPPQRAFSADEARAFRLDVQTQRDRATGEVFLVLNGSQRFADGYLVRTQALRGLAPEESLPPLDELQRFHAAATGDGAPGESDLAALAGDLAAAGVGGAAGGGAGAAPGAAFRAGDRVAVVEGDLRDVRGEVVRVRDAADAGGAPAVEVRLAGDAVGGHVVEFRPRELRKVFAEGDHVQVVAGAHAGQTGLVVSLAGPVARVFTDAGRAEVEVFARDLAAAGAAAGAADAIGGFDLHDIVALDAGAAGVIVGVDGGGETCRVLTNQGRPDAPDVRTCRLPDLKRRIADRRAAALDGARAEVGYGDAVEVAEGPLRGRAGTVRGVVRGSLFIHTPEAAEHGGFAVVPARQCRVRGGAARAAAGGYANPSATPGRALASPFPYAGAGGGAAGVLASPAPHSAAFGFGGPPGPGGRAGQFAGRVSTAADRMLEGRTVKIPRGPYRGMKGRILSATSTHARVELEAQMKTVTVSRAHLEEGGAPPGGYGAPPGGGWGAPPAGFGFGAAQGRTPAHPGFAGPTPAHGFGGGATPAHPGFAGPTPGRVVPPTPAYDAAAWAVTPAHPGFGAPEEPPPYAAAPPPPQQPYGAPPPMFSAAAAAAAQQQPPPYGAPPPAQPYGAPPPAYAAPPPGYGAAPPPPAAPAAPPPEYAHWVGIEVIVVTTGAVGVVEAPDPAAPAAGALVRPLGGGPARPAGWAELQPVPPRVGDRVRVVRAPPGGGRELLGREGRLEQLDGTDGSAFVAMGPELMALAIGEVARLPPV